MAPPRTESPSRTGGKAGPSCPPLHNVETSFGARTAASCIRSITRRRNSGRVYGRYTCQKITNFGLEPKHSKINTWQASGFEREKYFGEVGPSYVSDLRRKRPEELALSPRTMVSEAILERDEWWDVDPRSNRFMSKVVPVPGSKGAPKIDKRKLPKAYVPDPVESERAYRGIGRKESTHCVGDDIFGRSRMRSTTPWKGGCALITVQATCGPIEPCARAHQSRWTGRTWRILRSRCGLYQNSPRSKHQNATIVPYFTRARAQDRDDFLVPSAPSRGRPRPCVRCLATLVCVCTTLKDHPIRRYKSVVRGEFKSRVGRAHFKHTNQVAAEVDE